MSEKKRERIILFLYLAAFFVMAGTLALFQPLADTPPLYVNPPDEHARFLVPQYICEHGVIPTGFEEEIRIQRYGFSYGLYNVFPYIVQGYAMRFANLFTDSLQILLYVARFVNVFSGTLMAYVVYRLSGRLFEDRRFGWLFCFGVMFLPQSLFLHTYVNTDSFCLLSTAIMVYALVWAYQEGFYWKNGVILSIGIILCALSYYNAYGFILSSILLFLVFFLRKKDGRFSYQWKPMLRNGIFISILVLLGISWWFVRSYIVLDGDLLGLATREKMAAMYGEQIITYQDLGYTVGQMMKETDFLEGAFISFVAAYGSMKVCGSIWMYRFFKIFFALGAAGCILIPAKSAGGAVGLEKGREHGVSRGHRGFFHANMVFCILMPFLLLIHYAYTMDYQNQGRYLLPAIVPLMYYVVRGFQKLCGLRKLPGWLGNLVTVGCILFLVCSSAWMVYAVDLPLCLETGVVLQ